MKYFLYDYCKRKLSVIIVQHFAKLIYSLFQLQTTLRTSVAVIQTSFYNLFSWWIYWVISSRFPTCSTSCPQKSVSSSSVNFRVRLSINNSSIFWRYYLVFEYGCSIPSFITGRTLIGVLSDSFFERWLNLADNGLMILKILIELFLQNVLKRFL